MRRYAAVLSVLLLAGCDSPTETSTSLVNLLATTFSPSEIEINRGTVITWVNANAIEHTITPISHTQWEERVMTASGERFSHRFDVLGTYEYECTVHPGMRGEIIVVNPPT